MLALPGCSLAVLDVFCRQNTVQTCLDMIHSFMRILERRMGVHCSFGLGGLAFALPLLPFCSYWHSTCATTGKAFDDRDNRLVLLAAA